MKLLEAYQIAAVLHKGQTDKAGKPYIQHVNRVFIRVLDNGGSRHQQMAALLHDCIEDGKVTAEKLLEDGVPAEVVEIVQAVTHKPNEPQSSYASRIKDQPGALLVKLADIDDNSDPKRLSELPIDVADRLRNKYARMRSLLETKTELCHAN